MGPVRDGRAGGFELSSGKIGTEGVDGPTAEAAEAVRAYLVSVRGGAALLSSADARLLYGWLQEGVRLGAIVRAIDLVAARRLAQRVRAPLSLVSCRAEVVRQQRQAGSWVRRGGTRPVARADGDARYAAVERLAEAAERAVAALPGDDAARRAARACLIAAEFHDAAWQAAPQALLLAEAGEAMADARGLYDEAAWVEALEATARDALRRRYPSLTATALWQELGPGLD